MSTCHLPLSLKNNLSIAYDPRRPDAPRVRTRGMRTAEREGRFCRPRRGNRPHRCIPCTRRCARASRQATDRAVPLAASLRRTLFVPGWQPLCVSATRARWSAQGCSSSWALFLSYSFGEMRANSARNSNRSQNRIALADVRH